MWGALLSFLGGPLISGAISAYKAKLEAGNTQDRMAVELAERELQVQQRESELQADYKRQLIGHWYEPANLAAYVFVFYFAKVVVFDTMLGLGTTPAIKGNVGEWMGLVAAFLFGKRGVENLGMTIASVFRSRR